MCAWVGVLREKLLTDLQGYSSGRAYYFRAASTVQCMPFCFIQKKSNKSRCGISWRQDSTCLAHLLYVFEPFYGRALTALTLQEEKQEFKSTLTSLAEAARRRKEATTVFERTQYAVRQACVFASLTLSPITRICRTGVRSDSIPVPRGFYHHCGARNVRRVGGSGCCGAWRVPIREAAVLHSNQECRKKNSSPFW